jgi:hypothetical protein
MMINYPEMPQRGTTCVAVPEPKQVQWYVVFRDSENRSWFSLFTRRGFRHCYAFGRWDTNWVRVDPLLSWAQVDVIEQAELVKNGFQDFVELVKREDPSVRVLCVNRVMAPRGVSLLLPPTCVSVVKYLLGIRSKAVTPWGLYIELIEKYNAIPV